VSRDRRVRSTRPPSVHPSHQLLRDLVSARTRSRTGLAGLRLRSSCKACSLTRTGAFPRHAGQHVHYFRRRQQQAVVEDSALLATSSSLSPSAPPARFHLLATVALVSGYRCEASPSRPGLRQRGHALGRRVLLQQRARSGPPRGATTGFLEAQTASHARFLRITEQDFRFRCHTATSASPPGPGRPRAPPAGLG